MLLLGEKVCIVTGAAGSIGAATAKLFLDHGARVALVDRNSEALVAVAGTLPSDRIMTAVADVTDSAQTLDFVERTYRKWGAIDVLFANAGNDGPLMAVENYPEDLFDRVVTTHVKGCFLSCRHVLPRMKKGGSIVITSSITGVKGVPGNVSYVAAKHALVGIMRGICKEIGPRGIRINTINPGPIDNDFMRTAEKSMSKLLGREAGEMFDEMIPMKRHGTPIEVAQAALFLASDMSSYTTGSTLMVDGGLTA